MFVTKYMIFIIFSSLNMSDFFNSAFNIKINTSHSKHLNKQNTTSLFLKELYPRVTCFDALKQSTGICEHPITYHV